MPVTVIVDTAGGDSGKGKLAAHLVARHAVDHVAAGGTGPSAAHNIVDRRGRSITVRQVPLGFLSPTAHLYIGPGTLIDLSLLNEEIDMLESLGHEVRDRLVVDYRCGLIAQDATTRERRAGFHERGISWEVGTTAARADYVWRRIRRVESIDPTHFTVSDVPALLNHSSARGEDVLAVGAHGPSYSLYNGTNYPYVTSDDCGVVSVLGRTGLSWRSVAEVVGVCNMMPVTTMPVELAHEMSEEEVRRRGLHSVGAVSGRVRRVASAIDDRLLTHFVEMESPTRLALGRMDLFDPASAGARTMIGLSPRSRGEVDRVEDIAGVPVTYISTGAGIDDVVVRT